MKIPSWFQESKEYTSKSNYKYTVSNYTSGTGSQRATCLVMFTATGYEYISLASQAKIGSVKDKMSPSVFGVGFFGEGPHKASVRGRTTSAYNCWTNMLERCYSPDHHNYHVYGGVGVTVCDEWHNFQNFAEWYTDNLPNTYSEWHLDKDINSGDSHGMVYSPDYCKFATPQENTEHSQGATVELISPDGSLVGVFNIRKFCRDNNINRKSFQNMLSGKWSHHKGWKKAE
ncbi:winged helix-turn-helix DNA-binding domain protein [Vibrio phage 1.167.O._10N.261.51.F2]|nr:winged helix-turn-helix DNA-binding domain protein [Vibrio phage 1.167.O._10N.261.51.F2]